MYRWFLFASLIATSIGAQGQHWDYYANIFEPKQIIARDGLLFISSAQGIISIDPSSGVQHWYNHSNTDLLVEDRALLCLDGTGELWASYLDGIWKFDQGTWIFADSLSTDPSLAPNYAFLFANGDLWYAVSDGVVRRSGNDVFAYVGTDSPIYPPSYYVTDIAAGQDSSIWLATNMGLMRFASGSWSIWNTDNSAITTNYLTEVDADPTGVWIRSGFGIQHFNGETFDQSFDYTNSPIVPSLISGMDVSPSGSLFLSMTSGSVYGQPPCYSCERGLIEYSNGVFTRYDDTNPGLSIPNLSAVYCAENGHVYCASVDGTCSTSSTERGMSTFLGIPRSHQPL